MNNYLFSFTQKKCFPVPGLITDNTKYFSQKDANKLPSDTKVTSQISPDIKITVSISSGCCRIDVIFF